MLVRRQNLTTVHENSRYVSLKIINVKVSACTEGSIFASSAATYCSVNKNIATN